MKISAISRLL